MKKFFSEFKQFITRGNVLDMAVGVIVGGAFTGIVNGLSNYILKPIINWIIALVLGKEGLSGAITYLSKVEVDGVVDLANSIYIDWGAFVSAVINFLLIAIVLFTIVKTFNKIREESNDLKKGLLTKEDKKELKARGIRRTNIEGVKAYLKEKEELKKQLEEQEKKAQEEKARLDRLANPTVEDLLKDIKNILQSK